MSNVAKLSIGSRYRLTTENCPKCHSSKLMIDKMSANCTLFVCLHCNYQEEREENENEIVSDYHGSTR